MRRLVWRKSNPILLLDVVDRLLDVDLALEPLLLPVQGSHVALPASEEQVSAVSGVVEDVGTELLQVELEALRSGLLVDAFPELRLADPGGELLGVVGFRFEKAGLLLQK